MRRSSGSTSVTARSGRASATAIPGSPAPLPTSTTVAPDRHQLTQHGAVQHVPVPQPRHLARPDQSSLHPARRQVHGEPPRQPHLLPEDAVEDVGVDRLEVGGAGRAASQVAPGGCFT